MTTHIEQPQTQIIAAGDLTHEHVGKGLWAAVYSGGEWRDGWRRISMISHTTKGVKVHRSKSGSIDDSYAPEDLLTITTEDYS